MNEILLNSFSWIKEDWESHRACHLLLTTIDTIGRLRIL